VTIAGHLAGVSDDRFGSELTADLGIGDTVVHVESTVVFDEEQGGKVLIGGVTLAYDAFDSDDDDPDTDGPTELTLTAPSTVAADSGDPVWAFDPTTGADDPVTETIALCTIDDRDDGNAIPARIRAGLVEQLDSDFQTYIGKAVELDVINGELVLVDVLGSVSTGGVKFDQDETTAVGPGGVVTLDLKYIPEANSEHLYIGGVYQRGAVWTRDRWTVSIPDPDGELAAGNKIAMEYAYRDPTMKPPTVYSAPTWHQRAHTYNSLASSHITSQPLPVDAQLGDLLVVTGIGGGGCTLADPRLTTVAWILNGSTQILAVAVGYATTLDDLTVDVTGLALPLDQFGGVEVLAVRGDAGEGVAYDPTRIDSATSHTGPGSPLATVAGAGNGVIIATVAGWADPFTTDWATYVPDYDDWGGAGGTAVHSNFGYSADNSPPAQQNPFNIGLLAAVIGLK
jgi:hypothetical protein